jgi:hypothetical protein
MGEMGTENKIGYFSRQRNEMMGQERIRREIKLG